MPRQGTADLAPAIGGPDAAWREKFRRRLTDWFSKHARDLPWRKTRDPYRIWVSEIMLQQTQVATVGPYFERFLAAFPTVDALAAADEQEVLRLWEGLGYYRRARQMHQAARVIVERHGGRFPEDFAAVRALPGIGRYTAGAVLSIALDQRLPILEANSIRVLCRLAAYRGDPLKSAGQNLLWALAEELLPRKHVGTFNQALMELGSKVCTPRSPRCGECPVRELCPTQAHGWQETIPAPPRKTRYEEVREAAVIVRRKGEVLLRRCGTDERWAGLWDFPRFAVAAERDGDLADELAAKVKQLTGVSIVPEAELITLRHGVTRFRITLSCHLARYRAGRLKSAASAGGVELCWAAPAMLGEFPLSVTGRKIARLLQSAAASS